MRVNLNIKKSKFNIKTKYNKLYTSNFCRYHLKKITGESKFKYQKKVKQTYYFIFGYHTKYIVQHTRYVQFFFLLSLKKVS